MIDRRGLALLGDEPGTAEHAVTGEGWPQLCLLPGPVQHIRAGDVHEGEGSFAFPRVPQVRQRADGQVAGSAAGDASPRRCVLQQ